MVLMGFAIIGKAYKIQTVDDGYWAALADSLSTDLMSIPAERGNIYSADDRLLATSLPYFELRMDLASPAMTNDLFNENVDGLARKMAEHWGGKSYTEYKRNLIDARSRGSRYHLLKRKVDYNELKEIKTWPLFNLGKYKGGLIVETRQTRKLPYGQLASRTIGYVRENAQSIGLEAEFDQELSGREGRRLMQRIAGGTWVPLTDENAKDPQNGKDVYTTIDVNLQDVAQNALMQSMSANEATKGCVVVMEVATGEIKAIANLGKTRSGGYGEIYNYAVGMRTEPGSTFKVASMLALLEDGYIEPNDSVDVNNGRAVFYGEEMFDAGNWNPYKEIPAWKVLTISSNVGVAKFTNEAYRHDRQKFYDRLKQYNLTERTGISIKGEPKPYIKDPSVDEWSRLTVPWMSTGYELQLTPLQLLTFYNAIANGGKMIKPRLVNRIMDHGREIETYKAEVLERQISDPEAIEKLTDMMVRVVEEGTARNIRSEHYSIAGKTGTAKLYSAEEGYINKYQASFAGFYPADAPKYSCIVVVIGPSQGLTHGGQVAAPVFKEIADKVMSVDIDMHDPYNTLDSNATLASLDFTAHLNDFKVLAGLFNLESQGFADATYVKATIDKEGKQEFKPIQIEENSVPDVSGMSIDDALFRLENAGLVVQFSGKGRVLKQSVSPGTSIQKGMTIQLQLG